MNNNREGFLNGFLWGAIIGGIVVFFLTSKKGRKILKLLTEEGLEGVSELEELLGDKIDEEDYEEEPLPRTEEKKHSNGNGPARNASLPASQVQRGGLGANVAGGESSTFQKIKSTGRRFFKGVPRKN